MNEFIYLSRLYGNLDELVQAGGGNISVKTPEYMLIKASGYNLSDITESDGYVKINSSNNSNLTPNQTPSIETHFHLFMHKYTVHLHPTLINLYMCSNKLFDINSLNYRYLIIDYIKPGIELSNMIKSKYNYESIIFLRSHGVIFTSNDINALKLMIANVYNYFIKLSNNINNINNFTNLSDYEQLFIKYNTLNRIVYRVPQVYQADLYDPIIPYTPDIVVYLINSIIVHNNIVYIVANTKYKCLQILEVARSYIMLKSNKITHVLSMNEVDELINWKSEIARLNK